MEDGKSDREAAACVGVESLLHPSGLHHNPHTTSASLLLAP